ncbi:hypothetical protein Poly24_32350 [Rosistilla carotiformis]|uniref:SGNH hydrolase-type esterase domain-containing protein n=1 Tax=Rosistilla carotiformis TaxID=2528017 RepID=A0A518JVG5_9BACT|nr:hypothetical protein [Rosistilla carotiformis]QDV69519.1 hypothetical protein Poly24_32350 [Rosistilla carotiformis]
MRLFLIKLSILLATFFVLNSAFAWYISDNVTANRRSKYHWVCSLEANRYDFAFVGSSRVEMMVDPHVIDDTLGTNSVNIGVSGGGSADQFLLTSKLLRQNDVSVCFLQIDYLSISNKFTYPFRDYIWLCYDNDPVVQESLIEHCGSFRYWTWKGIPFLRFMEFASQYKKLIHSNAGEYWEQRKGGQKRDVPYSSAVEDSFHVYTPNELAVEYLFHTIELCHQHGVRLILFQAPVSPNLSSVSSYPKCTDRILAITQEFNLEYWDFSNLYESQGDLFYDNHHLNSIGAERFSKILAQRISTIVLPERDAT